MKQFERFKAALADGRYPEAAILIRDLIASHPNKLAYLAAYLELLSADDSGDLEQRISELQELKKQFVLLLSRGGIRAISAARTTEFERKITDLQSALQTLDDERKKSSVDRLKATNCEILDYLGKRLDDLENIVDRGQFDMLIADVKEAESRLIVSRFDREEELRYDHLIDSYASKITSWTTFFSNCDLREYNRQALSSFKSGLDIFQKEHRHLCRDPERLKALLAEKLFCYDLNKLYREVAEFYNFTYNFIFQRLDGDDKYKMAELALDTVKK